MLLKSVTLFSISLASDHRMGFADCLVKSSSLSFYKWNMKQQRRGQQEIYTPYHRSFKRPSLF
ncbi:hypothetical protein SD77_3850 [Bacillus badius]|uniref:Ribose 5-phosphate isomerase B n=1 Tax=Bacillus badius TaxID=1455 RepID=A0ABR5AWF1_BACBA|nr:hypothetical protein SD78_1653 [Bacillus badius]KIL79049.1 hypothetical protein SD77_3850 [Bacillus badius]